MFEQAGRMPATLRDRILGCCAAAIAAVVLAACSRAETQTAPPPIKVEAGHVIFSPGSPQLASLTYAEAVEAPPLAARIPGRLVWDEEHTVRVFPVFAGRVVHIHVKPGDMVKGGARNIKSSFYLNSVKNRYL